MKISIKIHQPERELTLIPIIETILNRAMTKRNEKVNSTLIYEDLRTRKPFYAEIEDSDFEKVKKELEILGNIEVNRSK